MNELTFVPASDELHAPATLFRGEALYRLGRLAESEQVFLRFQREHPDDPTACRWLAAIYYDLGAMNQAIERLERLARLEPKDYAPHRLLGTIRLDFELYDKAIADFEKALERSPPEAVRREVVRDLAKAMVRERRYEEALKVLEGEAEDADVLAMRCESQWNLDRREEARRTWLRAHDLAPDDRAVQLFGARMYADDDQPDRAVPLLKKALESDPHDPEARYQLAMAYRQLGRAAEADQEMAKKDESQKLRDRLTRLNVDAIDRPRDAAVRDELADVCRQLGKEDLAEMWRKAAEECRRLAGGTT